MLSLSRKVEYSLIALAHLAGRETETVPAREIAQTASLPLPIVMKILNRLQVNGLVTGVRGVKGGYRLGKNLDLVSLATLVSAVEDNPPETRRHRHAPVQALQYRIMRFLEDVKLSDLVIPGRRIDVPLEMLAAN
jgi:Rrf2 family protein